MRVVIISSPAAALMTTAAVSTASSAPIDWPMKSGKPGVSIRWIRASGVSRCMIDARSECWSRSSRAGRSRRRWCRARRCRPHRTCLRGEQRLGERRLAGRPVPHQRYGTKLLVVYSAMPFSFGMDDRRSGEFTAGPEPDGDAACRDAQERRRVKLRARRRRREQSRQRGGRSRKRRASGISRRACRIDARPPRGGRGPRRLRRARRRPASPAGCAAAPLPGRACRGRGRRRARRRGLRCLSAVRDVIMTIGMCAFAASLAQRLA